MDYETVVSVLPPLGITAADSWQCILYQTGHPIEPLAFVVTSTLGLVNYGGAFNPTLAGADIGAQSLAFLGLCNAWRLTYSSITADLDAAGLNDQGSVIAAQYPLATTVLNLSTSQAANPFATIFTHVTSSDYAQNKPGLSLGQLPGAFMGLAKEGVYMPYKMDPASDWANAECPTLVVPYAAQLPRGYALPNAATPVGETFPFYGQPAYQAAIGQVVTGAQPAYSTALNAVSGTLIQPMQQFNMGTTVFYNMAPTARITVKVKWGVEMLVPATSPLAPTMKPSAHLDNLALTAFSELNASLPWAYPSSYNSDNLLMRTIKDLWNAIKGPASQVLSMVPHPAGPAAAMAINALPRFERPAATGNPPKQRKMKGGGQQQQRQKKPKKGNRNKQQQRMGNGGPMGGLFR